MISPEATTEFIVGRTYKHIWNLPASAHTNTTAVCVGHKRNDQAILENKDGHIFTASPGTWFDWYKYIIDNCIPDVYKQDIETQ